MPSDYLAIKEDNKKLYGTNIKRIGKMLLSDRYADSSHCIFELIQNSEDAYKGRQDKVADSSIIFKLYSDHLRRSHFDQSVAMEDVVGICGIAQNTKYDSNFCMGWNLIVTRYNWNSIYYIWS